MLNNGSDRIVFDLQLPEGKTICITWSYDEQGKAGGACFMEVGFTLDERFNFFHCGGLFHSGSC